ncbi:hypothetical protein [Planctobacterium marinum]|uniref:Uncharacterized protein n=1 Tax=Planctobacterium marinum TaxID=1631968 RepID=A0AA48HSG8_9ALTE|nr:hypothetical protein MACH26_34080 [Planctobacterium marinum]
MNKSFLVISIIASLSFGTQAEENLKAVYKDAQIMQNILTTSLKQNTRKEGIRFRKIESGYLAGQGLLFDVYTSSSRNMHFSFDLGTMVQSIEGMVEAFDFPPAPPAPTVPDLTSDSENFVFSFEVDEDMEDYIEEVQERTREVMREQRERRRELQERERDLNWEAREYERRVRDMEFEMRHAEKERKKELEKGVKEVKAELEKLEAKKAEYAKKAKQLAEEEEKRQAKLEEAKNQMTNRFLADFEATIADTLCDYGSGLKSLPDTEKVNFILKDFVRDDNRRSDKDIDKIYVFNLKDVKQCVQEKISPNDLLTKAQTYMF